jgi:kynureninase
LKDIFYAEKPWWDYHERFKPLGKIMGIPSEITV